MATIQLHNDCPNTYVSVPGIFIDKYMTDANGEFVKVYLYLLHCLNAYASNCTISAIADHFNHTENDVLRALKYWEKVGVLKLLTDDNDCVCRISFSDLTSVKKASLDSTPSSSAVPAGKAAPSNAKVVHSNATEAVEKSAKAVASAPVRKAAASDAAKKEYTLDEVKKFNEDPEVAELLFIIETYLKQPLKASEMNMIFYWLDHLHLSRDLVEYLVEHCISNGHSSFHYMDKVAFGWAEDGITSVEQAKDHSSNRSKTCYGVMKALGIAGRNLIDSEVSFVNKWTKEFGFDMVLVEEACKRTISAIHQPSFEYTDSILTNWHAKKVHTLKDVEALDASFSKAKKAASTSRTVNSAKNNKFINFNQRTYDYEQLEKDLLTTSVQ